MENVNTNKKLCSLSFVLLTLFVSTSCNSRSSGSDSVEINNTGNRASCEFTFTDGFDAPMSLPTQDLKTTLFSKIYDESLLTSVSMSSASELERFAKLAGVTYFKVDNLNLKKRGCLFSQTLPQAPLAIENYFRDAEAQVNSEQTSGSTSTLLGFFLDKDQVQVQTRGYMSTPLIVVKNDSDKYTMIHEYMHYLFEKESSVSGLSLQMKKRTSKSIVKSSIEAFNKSETVDNYTKLIDDLTVYVDDFLAVLKKYSLEEVAIESELSQLYSAQELTKVSPSRRLNGDYYIMSSAKDSNENIDQLVSTLTEISNDPIQKKIIDLNQAALLNQKIMSMKNKLRDLKYQTTLVAIQAQNRIKQNLTGLRSDSDLNLSQFPCSHSHLIDKDVKIKFKLK